MGCVTLVIVFLLPDWPGFKSLPAFTLAPDRGVEVELEAGLEGCWLVVSGADLDALGEEFEMVVDLPRVGDSTQTFRFKREDGFRCNWISTREVMADLAFGVPFDASSPSVGHLSVKAVGDLRRPVTVQLRVY